MLLCAFFKIVRSSLKSKTTWNAACAVSDNARKESICSLLIPGRTWLDSQTLSPRPAHSGEVWISCRLQPKRTAIDFQFQRRGKLPISWSGLCSHKPRWFPSSFERIRGNREIHGKSNRDYVSTYSGPAKAQTNRGNPKGLNIMYIHNLLQRCYLLKRKVFLFYFNRFVWSAGFLSQKQRIWLLPELQSWVSFHKA